MSALYNLNTIKRTVLYKIIKAHWPLTVSKIFTCLLYTSDKWRQSYTVLFLWSLKGPLGDDASCCCCGTSHGVMFGGCPHCWFCAAVLFTPQRGVESQSMGSGLSSNNMEQKEGEWRK